MDGQDGSGWGYRSTTGPGLMVVGLSNRNMRVHNIIVFIFEIFSVRFLKS